MCKLCGGEHNITECPSVLYQFTEDTKEFALQCRRCGTFLGYSKYNPKILCPECRQEAVREREKTRRIKYHG